MVDGVVEQLFQIENCMSTLRKRPRAHYNKVDTGTKGPSGSEDWYSSDRYS
jgi:hypothetical protein